MAILDQILSHISAASASAGVIALVLEFILRLVKSEKPLSILYIVGGVLKKLGAIFSGLGELSDKVLPQRLK